VNNHLWLDLGQTVGFINHLAEELADRFPAIAEDIHHNAQNLTRELEEMDEEFRDALRAVPQKRLVTFHNAFDPLVERYGLNVVQHLTEIELSPGGEVTPQSLEQAIAAIREHDLKVIYAEPQFPRGAVERLREITGVAVLTLDPEGNPSVTGYETYQAMMRSNVATLLDGQSR
jgi:zinc transport system substrate-binding protein